MAVILAFLLAAPAWAETPDEIRKAYEAGFCIRAFEFWLPRAERGDPEAQMGLSDYFSDGQCGAEDDAKAQYWLRKAAEQGYAKAQNSLGMAFYLEELGLPPDLIQAFMWTSRARQNGYDGYSMHEDILAEMDEFEVQLACEHVDCPPDIAEEHARLAAIREREQYERDVESADIEVCNEGIFETIYVAFAEQAGTDDNGRPLWRSQGWRHLKYDECTTLWTGPLNNAYYYVYGESDGGKWGGDYFFCVHTEAFDLIGAHQGECDDTRGFYQIDMAIGDRRRHGYTLNLNP